MAVYAPKAGLTTAMKLKKKTVDLSFSGWFIGRVLAEKMAAEQNGVKIPSAEENKENSIDQSIGLESILNVKFNLQCHLFFSGGDHHYFNS